jgi:hypothetical protein
VAEARVPGRCRVARRKQSVLLREPTHLYREGAGKVQGRYREGTGKVPCRPSEAECAPPRAYAPARPRPPASALRPSLRVARGPPAILGSWSVVSMCSSRSTWCERRRGEKKVPAVLSKVAEILGRS